MAEESESQCKLVSDHPSIHSLFLSQLARSSLNHCVISWRLTRIPARARHHAQGKGRGGGWWICCGFKSSCEQKNFLTIPRKFRRSRRRKTEAVGGGGNPLGSHQPHTSSMILLTSKWISHAFPCMWLLHIPVHSYWIARLVMQESCFSLILNGNIMGQ